MRPPRSELSGPVLAAVAPSLPRSAVLCDAPLATQEPRLVGLDALSESEMDLVLSLAATASHADPIFSVASPSLLFRRASRARPRLSPPDTLLAKPVPTVSEEHFQTSSPSSSTCLSESSFLSPEHSLYSSSSSYSSSPSGVPPSYAHYSEQTEDEFGFVVDAPYVADAPVASLLPLHSPSPVPFPSPAECAFLDGIIQSVRQEISSEKKSSTTSSPSLPASLSLLASSAAQQQSAVEIITSLSCSGKQFRVIIEPIEEEQSNFREMSSPALSSVCSASPSSSAFSNPPTRKCSTVFSGKGSPSHSEEEESKRPRIDISTLSEEEAAARKRLQNRKAAARYRRKQRDARVQDKTEVDYFESRNEFLRKEEKRLTGEISRLKRLFMAEISS